MKPPPAPPSNSFAAVRSPTRDGAGRQHRDQLHDPCGGASDRGGPTESDAGLHVNVAPPPDDPSLRRELILHRASEIAVRQPALGFRQPPLQIRARRRSTVAVGRLPVQPQDPRRHRNLPLSFFPRSRLRHR